MHLQVILAFAAHRMLIRCLLAETHRAAPRPTRLDTGASPPQDSVEEEASARGQTFEIVTVTFVMRQLRSEEKATEVIGRAGTVT